MKIALIYPTIDKERVKHSNEVKALMEKFLKFNLIGEKK